MSSPPQLGDVFPPPAGPPPCISPGACPFSFCSASSAPRSPSSAGGLLRRNPADEESERTPLNLKPRLAGVGVPHGSPSRCTPRASARAHSGARRGPVACCATALARRARPGLGLRYPEDRPALHSPFRCACALRVLLGLDLPFLRHCAFAAGSREGGAVGGCGRDRVFFLPVPRASCGMFAPPLAGAHNPGSSAVA